MSDSSGLNFIGILIIILINLNKCLYKRSCVRYPTKATNIVPPPNNDKQTVINDFPNIIIDLTF